MNCAFKEGDSQMKMEKYNPENQRKRSSNKALEQKWEDFSFGQWVKPTEMG